jgi:hypothetical protein
MAQAAAAGQRARLLADWSDTEDEEAVTELSKLGARADVYGHKIATQNGKLANADAELKTALAQFATSFNTLYLLLRVHVARDAASRIADLVHPDLRQISADAISDVAERTIAVVNLRPLQINLDPGLTSFDNMLTAQNIYLAAERALPKVDALWPKLPNRFRTASSRQCPSRWLAGKLIWRRAEHLLPPLRSGPRKRRFG